MLTAVCFHSRLLASPCLNNAGHIKPKRTRFSGSCASDVGTSLWKWSDGWVTMFKLCSIQGLERCLRNPQQQQCQRDKRRFYMVGGSTVPRHASAYPLSDEGFACYQWALATSIPLITMGLTYLFPVISPCPNQEGVDTDSRNANSKYHRKIGYEINNNVENGTQEMVFLPRF